MYFVIDSHVNSTKDDHTNRIHTLGVAHNIMMQHWRNDNGETRVNCNFEVRITDKCDNIGLGAWVAGVSLKGEPGRTWPNLAEPGVAYAARTQV